MVREKSLPQRHEKLAKGESATIYIFIEDGCKLEEDENVIKQLAKPIRPNKAEHAEYSDLNEDEINDSNYVSQTRDELTSTIGATSSDEPTSRAPIEQSSIESPRESTNFKPTTEPTIEEIISASTPTKLQVSLDEGRNGW